MWKRYFGRRGLVHVDDRVPFLDRVFSVLSASPPWVANVREIDRHLLVHDRLIGRARLQSLNPTSLMFSLRHDRRLLRRGVGLRRRRATPWRMRAKRISREIASCDSPSRLVGDEQLPGPSCSGAETVGARTFV